MHTTTAPAPALGHQECGSNSGNGGLIKIATTWGGKRRGSGRNPKPLPTALYVPRWYCIQTEPRAELRVIHALKKLCFEVHFPKMMVDGKPDQQPRFPGYVFVRFAMHDAAWPVIHRIAGFTAFLPKTAERPVPLDRGYVEALIEEAGDLGFIDTRADAAGDLLPGTTVRLLGGHLPGFTGEVIWSSRRYVQVAVTIFGRTTPTTVARNAIEIANE